MTAAEKFRAEAAEFRTAAKVYRDDAAFWRRHGDAAKANDAEAHARVAAADAERFEQAARDAEMREAR